MPLITLVYCKSGNLKGKEEFIAYPWFQVD